VGLTDSLLEVQAGVEIPAPGSRSAGQVNPRAPRNAVGSHHRAPSSLWLEAAIRAAVVDVLGHADAPTPLGTSRGWPLAFNALSVGNADEATISISTSRAESRHDLMMPPGPLDRRSGIGELETRMRYWSAGPRPAPRPLGRRLIDRSPERFARTGSDTSARVCLALVRSNTGEAIGHLLASVPEIRSRAPGRRMPGPPACTGDAPRGRARRAGVGSCRAASAEFARRSSRRAGEARGRS
jgi:hypothetical protein